MSTLVGRTPTNWAETRLTDICLLVPGAPTHDDPEGSVPVLKPRNLLRGRLFGKTDMVDADKARQNPRYHVQRGDLLCARTGTVGRVGLASEEQEGWLFGSGLICIRPRPNSQVDPQYLALYFAHQAVSDWIIRHAKGTSIPSISAKVLGTIPVSLPPLPVQLSIAVALTTLNESIEAHQRICETTAELRDAVLPLLMSGVLSAS
jgi:hypothetical protein